MSKPCRVHVFGRALGLVPVLVPVLDDNVVTIIVWTEYKWSTMVD